MPSGWQKLRLLNRYIAHMTFGLLVLVKNSLSLQKQIRKHKQVHLKRPDRENTLYIFKINKIRIESERNRIYQL